MENSKNKEIWLPIIGYESLYMISNKSRFKSCDRIVYTHNNTRSKKIKGKILIKGKRKGYNSINLWKNNKMSTFNTHRLIAIHFIENPNNLKIIEHIDDNKLNDSIKNLKWSTTSENVLNGYYRSSKHNIKTVLQYDLSGNFIKEYDSAVLAGLQFKKNQANSSITRCCNNKANTAYGFIWQFKS